MSASDSPSIHDFLPRGLESDDGPVISAASSPDSSALIAILENAQALRVSDRSTYVLDQVHDAILDGRWDTPLLRAIAECRAGNVQVLLRYGADPNGVPWPCMAEHARGYRRFSERSRANAEKNFGLPALNLPLREESVVGVVSQVVPLSRSEAKGLDGLSPFWTDPMIPLSYISGDLSHSLVLAAERANEEVFDMLHEAGASSRFWQMEPREAVELFAVAQESELDISALCVCTPLDAAIETGNIHMLEALLARGLDPNTRALAAGSMALTPMQLAITKGNMDAYSLLASHPKADINLRTPVYGVHILHFAVAHLMPEQLASINAPLSEASTTALGHTLLHIASLPIDESCIQISALKVEQSIHFVRNIAFTQTHLLPQDPRIQQAAMCKYLISSLGTAELGKPDVHGNTALHYLAGNRSPDTELVEWMRARKWGEAVWTSTRNAWGLTPECLWADANAMVERPMRGTRRGRGRSRGYMCR